MVVRPSIVKEVQKQVEQDRKNYHRDWTEQYDRPLPEVINWKYFLISFPEIAKSLP